MRSSPPSRLAAAFAVAVVAAAVGAVVLLSAVAGPRSDARMRAHPAESRSLVADRPEVRAAALLDDWDRRRAAAWAAADAAALARLYAVGSALGRADRSMLAAWTARGLRVEGLLAQVIDVRVLSHRPGRWEVQVVDRVGDASVMSPTGARRPLPRDGPRTSRVVLLRRPGQPWVVADPEGTRPAGSATATRSAAPR